MKLGQILMQRRKIGLDHLREALRRQRQTGQPLGEILLHMGIVSRAEIVEALRRLPSGSVTASTLEQIPESTAGLIPAEMARELACIPVVPAPGALVVAMDDPLDAIAIDRLQRHLGMPVIPVAAPPEALAEAIERAYDAGEPSPAGGSP